MFEVIKKMPEIPPGWRRRRRLPDRMRDARDPMFDLAPNPCRIVVEVGAQWGYWTHRALKQLPEAIVYAVDPWEDSPRALKEWLGGSINLVEWAHNVKPWLGKRCFGLRGKTEEVAPRFDHKIDFLFIDADHHTPAVILDCQLWVPKVRQGGIIVGHDWGGPWKHQVRAGVKEYFKDIPEAKIEARNLYLSPHRGGRPRLFVPCWYVEKTW